jgi:arsenate reductase
VITIYHHPGCSKSRRAVEILEELGKPFTTRNYLETPLDAEELRVVITRLGIGDPRDMMRTGETEYRDRGLAEVGGETLIKAMVACPALIERPIVVAGERAVVARPPEVLRGFLAG